MKEFYYLKPWQYSSAVILFIVFAGIISWFIYIHVYPGIAIAKSELKLPIINLTSVISGKIKRVRVQGGAIVKQGQLLLELSKTPIKNQITKVEDRLALLGKQNSKSVSNCPPVESKKNKALELAQLGCQLAKEMETINQEAVSHLQQQIMVLKQQLAYTMIKAPVSGKILQIKVKKNQRIKPDTVLLEMMNATGAEMLIFLEKEQANLAELNSEARITLFNLDDIIIPATITFISPTAKKDHIVIEGTAQSNDLFYPLRLKITGDYLANHLDKLEPVMEGKAYIKLNPKADWPKALHKTMVKQ
ncbi:efflux RND transporter periplasmic adaptor subunit [Endozoicomonas sp. SM1973]|uniref:Efflux RND transporter periplasmic adaptor subunit n=1 Tax=Spartinivicinus marinus TaxID=2994442 RepID=A0A853IBL1_9GAMM|nr:efflux RND transporter periplasmic adaptor subunit [Spartinivicinus marinus]MCX4027262.1 efflux RND transporter periplasmic adaptor subunit [Spartinivicinus marinus]NYZ67978.1 efflux RND transporter periplasmic adaptor subunit [Spartinivicinus marinus]